MDLNNILLQGLYDFHVEGGLPLNLPIGISDRGNVTVIGRGSHRSQMIIDYAGSMYIRYVHVMGSNVTLTKWFKVETIKLES